MASAMSSQPTDPVNAERINHPKHYTSHPSGVEAIDLCEHLSFNLGNALKYAFRAPYKGAAEEDLAKARWYLERENARNRLLQELGDSNFENLSRIVFRLRAQPLLSLGKDPLANFFRDVIINAAWRADNARSAMLLQGSEPNGLLPERAIQLLNKLKG